MKNHFQVELWNFIFIFFVCFKFFADASKNLHIKGPPELLSEKSSIEKIVKLNQDVKLTCPAAGNPEPIIEWYKGIEKSPVENWDRFRRSKFSLRIKKVEIKEHGIYTCVAINGFGSVSFTFHLIVTGDAGGILNLPNENLKMHKVIPVAGSVVRKSPGSDFRFECSAVGDPQPHFTWIKNKSIIENSKIKETKILQNDFNKMIFSSTLVLTGINSADSGNYSCIVSNKFGVHMANWTLHVEDEFPFSPPKPTSLYMANVTSFSGEDATLSCSGDWNPENTPRVMWLRHLKEAVKNASKEETFMYKGKRYTVMKPTQLLLLQNKTFSTKLIIKNVQWSDAGTYVCTVSSRQGVHARQAQLTVFESPFEQRPILLVCGLTLGVLVLIVVVVSLTICQKNKRKPRLPYATERALLPHPAPIPQIKNVNSDNSRLVTQNFSQNRSCGPGVPIGMPPLNNFLQPTSLVHLTPSQLSQHGGGTGSEKRLTGSDHTVIGSTIQSCDGIYPTGNNFQEIATFGTQNSTMTGSFYLGQNDRFNNSTPPNRPLPFDYHKFDVL